ncbi:hypothetical protein Tco_0127658 [Tanacetum coccineum]
METRTLRVPNYGVRHAKGHLVQENGLLVELTWSARHGPYAWHNTVNRCKGDGVFWASGAWDAVRLLGGNGGPLGGGGGRCFGDGWHCMQVRAAVWGGGGGGG